MEPSLDLALRMADVADEMALGGFYGHLSITEKLDGTPVTHVDREVEATLRAMISDEQPGAGILGEEFGVTSGEDRWVIDPIDGTVNFIDGDPRFSVLIALERDREPIVGVVSAPALGLRWWASAGRGAFMSVKGEVSAARVSITRDLAEASSLLLGGGFRDGAIGIRERLAAATATQVGMGISWEAVRVATGDFDLGLTAGAWWDIAPLPIIVTEAGGAVHLFDAPDGRHGIAVSNRLLAGQVSSLL